MKKTKIIFFILVLPLIISLQGCSSNFNKNKSTNNNQTKTNITEKKQIDYVKEISKNSNNTSECDKYKERVDLEIKEYEKRINNDINQEKFKLIGIFKSKSLNKCFYVLENSYTNNDNKIIDYIINNAQEEETIDIFNNVDYDFLNERLEELQK